MTRVFLYVPNIIGYVRVLSGLASFWFAFDHPLVFALLYGSSYALDAVDGVAARKLKQTSHFGSVLDMVTDRFCSSCLLVVLSHLYKAHAFLFIALLALDLVSHWIQMYSSLLQGSGSHKAMATQDPGLLRFYYTFPFALFTLVLFNEAFLVLLYALYFNDAGAFGKFTLPTAHLVLLAKISLPFFVLKQIINVVQLQNAANKVVQFDEAAKARRSD